MKLIDASDWKRSNADVFWAEIAPCDHVVQIYEKDEAFFEALTGYVGGGIRAGDCVIVIATSQHCKELENKLRNLGINTKFLKEEDQLILLDATETLNKFLVNNWPDEELFNTTISQLLQKANSKNRKVRAFGEMVALLWAEGFNGATVQLEALWNKYCQKQPFTLFCAYPRIGFTNKMVDSISEICNCHSKVLHESDQSLTEVLYRNRV
jgi:hypothetical protein